jgi:hypothetical protein
MDVIYLAENNPVFETPSRRSLQDMTKMAQLREDALSNDEKLTSREIENIQPINGYNTDQGPSPLQVTYRGFADSTPLGLLSFATAMLLISLFGVHTRGVPVNNMMMGVLIFMGGVCQLFAGVGQFVAGNIVSTSVVC